MDNPSNVRETPKNKKNQGGVSLSVDEEEFYFKYIEPFSEEVHAENRAVRKKIILNGVFLFLIPLILYMSSQIGILEARKVHELVLEVIFIGFGIFFLKLLWKENPSVIISLLIFILIVYLKEGKGYNLVFEVAFIGFGIYFFKLLWGEKRSTLSKHIKQYKNKMIPEMLNYLGCDYYSARRSFEEEPKIKCFYPTSYYSNLVTNFFLRGNCKKIAYTMLAGRQVRKSKKNKITTVFEGLLFVFKTTKKFSSKTIVARKSKKLSKSAKQMPQVILEDPKFNSLFSVYSDNQIESRIFLTHAFMCRLISLEKKLNTKIDCSFYSGELLIRVPTRLNYFSINGKNLRKDFKAIISEMKIVSEIIEGLQLDLDKSA